MESHGHITVEFTTTEGTDKFTRLVDGLSKIAQVDENNEFFLKPGTYDIELESALIPEGIVHVEFWGKAEKEGMRQMEALCELAFLHGAKDISKVLYLTVHDERYSETNTQGYYTRHTLVDIKSLYKMWDEFGDIPVRSDDTIDKAFKHFPAGTSRFDIIDWFESKNVLFVAGEVMEGKRVTFIDD